MQEIAFLERLGLPKNAAMAYLALIEIGEGTVADIARKAQLHRPEVYRILPLLEEYRLASAIEVGKRTRYRAASPENLEVLREEFIASSERTIERLKQKAMKSGLQARLEHVQGVDSISKLYEEALRLTPKGGTYYRYSSGRQLHERSIYVSDAYTNLKNTKGIARYVITNELLKWRKPDPNRAVVAVPKDFDLFDDNISKLIYSDRVAIVDHDSKEAFVIESPRFVEFEKKIFRLLFRFLEGRRD